MWFNYCPGIQLVYLLAGLCLTIALTTTALTTESMPLIDSTNTVDCPVVNNDKLQSEIVGVQRSQFPSKKTLNIFFTVNEKIKQQAQQLSDCRKQIRHTETGSTILKNYRENWSQWISLIKCRSLLIDHLSTDNHKRYTGFGYRGVKQAKLEALIIANEATHAQFELHYGIKDFLQGLNVSPAPIIFILIKFVFWVLLYFLWVTKAIPFIKYYAEKKEDYIPWLKFLATLYLTMRIPLELYIISLIAISLVNDIDSFIFLHFLFIILSWLCLLAIVARFLDALCIDKDNKRACNNGLLKLRMKTIHWVARVIFIYAVVESLLHYIQLDNGAISHWVNCILVLATLPIIIILVYLWRNQIIMTLKSKNEKDSPIAKWVIDNNSGMMSAFCIFVGALYLFINWVIRFFLTLAANNKSIRIWLTYIFRIEVARQHAKVQKVNPLTPLSDNHKKAFQLDYKNTEYIEGIYDKLLLEVKTLCLASKSSISLIHGALASGKTDFAQHLIQSIQQEAPHYECLYLACPPGDFSNLMEAFTLGIGLEGDGSTHELVSLLKEAKTSFICIDDIQHLVRPSINGLNELDRLIRLIRRSSSNISWLLLIDTASWRFVERARGHRFIFDLEKELPKWPEKKITALIDQRNAIENIQADFSEIHLPRQFNENDVRGNDQELNRYSRMLWEFSKGNPGQALKLWQDSLYYPENKERRIKGKRIIATVRMFDTSDKQELEVLSISLLFVLRSILQLGLGSRDAIAKSTNLSIDETIDALRLLLTRGFIEKDDANNYKISWSWYQKIVHLLQRKHLLSL